MMALHQQPSQQQPAKPELQRLWIGATGCAKALFADNSLVILSGSGQSFVHVSPDGGRTRQLSQYALRRFAPALAEVLACRNLHVDAPLLCAALRQHQLPPDTVFHLGYPIVDLLWPLDAEEAFDQGLVEFLGARRIAVRSRCRSGRVVLDSSALRFAVCYPLLLEHDVEQNVFTYTWHTQVRAHRRALARRRALPLCGCAALSPAGACPAQQANMNRLLQVFSCAQHPPRWQPALAAARAVAANQERGFPVDPEAASCTPAAGAHEASAAAAASAPGGHAASSRRSVTHLPACLTAVDVSRQAGQCATLDSSGSGASLHAECLPEGDWWYDPSTLLPLDEHIIMLWTPAATYTCVQVRTALSVGLGSMHVQAAAVRRPALARPHHAVQCRVQRRRLPAGHGRGGGVAACRRLLHDHRPGGQIRAAHDPG
jgi:hypothetical protein